MSDKERCPRCRGQCCFVVKVDGIVRYSRVQPHGQGAHWCGCKNGYVKVGDSDESNEQTDD